MSRETVFITHASTARRLIQRLLGLTYEQPWKVTIERVEPGAGVDQEAVLRGKERIIAEFTGNDPDDVHEAMLAKHYGTEEVDPRRRPHSRAAGETRNGRGRMIFVAQIPDAKVTALVYRHLPSWPSVGCYFDWRAHYAKVQAKSGPAIGTRRRDGSVLTEEGWLLARSAENPRVIDEPSTKVMSPSDIAAQQRIDAEVAQVAEDHEIAVLSEDLWVFARQFRLVVEALVEAGADLRKANGLSKERQVFIAAWVKRARAWWHPEERAR